MKMSNARVYFAKLKDDVKIPTKRSEDAGFDIFANFDVDYMIIKPYDRTYPHLLNKLTRETMLCISCFLSSLAHLASSHSLSKYFTNGFSLII